MHVSTKAFLSAITLCAVIGGMSWLWGEPVPGWVYAALAIIGGEGTYIEDLNERVQRLEQ